MPARLNRAPTADVPDYPAPLVVIDAAGDCDRVFGEIQKEVARVLESVRGHDRVVNQLRQAMVQGRFPHALLFVGPEGIGKRTFARRLAQALLCERTCPDYELDPCGSCPGCVQVAADTHPDFVEVGRPDEKHELPIDVIRAVCDQYGLKPVRGQHKVAIVNDADDLNPEASNAFLKTLEEPPPGAVLILIGTSPELQLETILSRCQVVRFEPLPEADVAAILLEHGIARDAEDAARLAALSEGSVERATGLGDQELERFRRELIDELAADHGFEPPVLAQRMNAHIKRRSQGVGRPAPLRQSSGRRARPCISRGTLADRRIGSPLPRRCRPPGRPCSGDSARARRCAGIGRPLPPGRVSHPVRRLYMPLILESLMHDLGKMINARR